MKCFVGRMIQVRFYFENRCIVLLLYESGARVTELCNVHRYDLHLEKPFTLVLHGKGNKIRSVPLDGLVVDTISNYIQNMRYMTMTFFFSMQEGKD